MPITTIKKAKKSANGLMKMTCTNSWLQTVRHFKVW